MRALSAPELLNVWERGLAQPAARRALMLLAAASPDAPYDALAALSVGQRDARLLALREWAFGPQLVSLATCPGCGERLELMFNVAALTPSYARDEPVEPLSLRVADCEVSFRLPNSLDLVAIADLEDVDVPAVRRTLLARCLLEARQDGEDVTLDRLPGDVIDAVVERMARADPQADVRLAVPCPACGHEWRAVFDIVSFFWSEINAWAYRVLREVHVLASAYGWHEADVLRLSPWRRHCYLEMVSG
jgi:hypothetical protein